MVSHAVQVHLRNQVSDESFTQGIVQETLLLLLAERSRFLYALIDTERQKAVLLREFILAGEADPAQEYTEGFFEAIREADPILNRINPGKTVLAFHGLRHALVPEPLFSRQHLQEMLDLTSTPTGESRYFSDALSLSQAQFVYAVPEGLLRETGAAFGQPMVFHAAVAFIENELRLNKHEDQALVSVLLRPGVFDMVVTRGSELRFYNSFRYQSTEDFIYFLLFSLEQLQLNPDQVWVRAYGEIEKISSLWMVSRKYIRNFNLGGGFESLSYAYGFDRFSPHQFHNLFSQYLCVL